MIRKIRQTKGLYKIMVNRNKKLILNCLKWRNIFPKGMRDTNRKL